MKSIKSAWLTTACMAAISSLALASERPPNVIFFLTDDLGYSDVSCYGSKKVKTPHIDRLATEGLKFTHFHTAASICSPSRAAFLTGAYPQRAGLYMGINPIRKAHWFLGLNPDEITIAEQFKTRGYSTTLIGKWHLGTQPEFHMQNQGFDSSYGMHGNAGHVKTFFDGKEVLHASTPLDRLTELYTERAIKFVKEQGDKPFFIYFVHNYPHVPFKAGEKFRGTSQDGRRGDVIQEMDWGIGELMKALEETGVADDTIVIFSSDNGPNHTKHAAPYRGTKYVTFEGGHRVPFIFHWPAKIKQGRVIDTPVNAMDLFPTLSQAMGAALPEDRVYDGVSLLPLLDGKELSRKKDEPFYYYNNENLQAVRVGDWKMHLPRNEAQLPHWNMRSEFKNLKEPVLYNLAADPSEKKDVAKENPEVVEMILAVAKEARAELGEYLQRGSGQRATGSVIPFAPVLGNEKDWGQFVDESLNTKITEERLKRQPDQSKWVTPKKEKKKK